MQIHPQTGRRTKIVATIGPSSNSAHLLRKLIESGMDVARLNFSHGSHKSHQEIISQVRLLSKTLGKPIGILQDLQGIKIRTGNLRRGETVELRDGQIFTITTTPTEGDDKIVSTSYKTLPSDVTVGERILLSDGAIELEVVSIFPEAIDCLVVSGGALSPNQGINLPGTFISAPPLTEKDLADLAFGISHAVDYVALSFVRRAEDVLALKARLRQADVQIPVIAKLEKPRAIDDLEKILQAADGVMVARGDLGVETSPEIVPILQKKIIAEANRAGKLVITATQMLESMIRQPRPTRAEASDVANAILDGTDAVMLSGETASGRYPVESVEMMARIIVEAESLQIPGPKHKQSQENTFPAAICDAAFHASQSLPTRAIVAFTQTGSTALMICKYRPSCQILGFTPNLHIMNRISLFWGVEPMLMREIHSVDDLVAELEKTLLEKGLADPGDNVIVLTGFPLVATGNTSLLKLHRIGGEGSEVPP